MNLGAGGVKCTKQPMKVSVVGMLMGMAVCETVACQFLSENVSPLASKAVDTLARWSFPLFYLIFMVMMSYRAFSDGQYLTLVASL